MPHEDKVSFLIGKAADAMKVHKFAHHGSKKMQHWSSRPHGWPFSDISLRRARSKAFSLQLLAAAFEPGSSS
jgi:hypothetical protein